VSTSHHPNVQPNPLTALSTGFFTYEHVYSAASMEPPTSKPDPAVYLHACKELGVKPEECVTVEDSKSGATAALRANIPLVAYVGIYNIEEGKEKMDQMATTLKEQCKAKSVMYDWKEWQECLKKAEESL
jgi:beta-phosphoglucomutase-like phosphatase (HAD superfamily)